MGRRRLCLAWLVLVLLLAACGGGGDGRRGTNPAAGASATSTSPGAPTWQLVWFSDSGAWGVASDWAERIGKAQGVDVQVIDYIGYGSWGSAESVLARVTSDKAVRRQLADAEVVVVYGSNYDVPLDYQRACMSLASRKQPAPLTRRVLQPFRDKLNRIYDEVISLRAGQPTIIRALDLYAPMVATWRSAGVYRACSAGWAATARVQSEVAAEHGVPMASLYDAFNGPRHDLDPVKRGFIGPDGGHTSTRGKTVILRTLDALGYEPVTP